ncbi:MAG TPA: tetratricopeptide repeat protein [Luteimonas sp.]|nr:tetratricopeptide repeat protein [Luteimonas sp.]
MFSWILAAALALPVPPPVAASTAPAAPAPVPATHPIPLPAVDPIPRDEVMALPPELRDRLHEAVMAGEPMPTVRFQRLAHFIVDDDGLAMTYQENATYTVAQAYATRQANCLTFTLLVIALAKEAGLEAYPQEMGETLSWREVGGTVYRDNHINAGIRVGGHRYTIDPAADLVLIPQPPVIVSHERLLAHYYNNVAVDRLQDGLLPAAMRNMDVALALDPGYATLWSNVGVMRSRNGDANGAEHAYQRALALNPKDASALFNMVQLLDRRGDPREGYYRQRLARVEQKDPLQQYLEALDFERARDYPHAIEHLQRAIQLKRDEDRFYAALARVYESAGDTTRASSALARAQSLSEGRNKAMYRTARDRITNSSYGVKQD